MRNLPREIHYDLIEEDMMNLHLSGVAALLVIGAACFSNNDALTLADGSTLHGRIRQLDQNQVTIEGRALPRAEVRAVDFNASGFNRAEFSGGSTISTPPAHSDVVTLASGERRPCDAAALESGKIHCGNQTFERYAVRRLELRP